MNESDRVVQVEVNLIDDSMGGNMRESIDERECKALAVSIQSIGIQVPLLLMRGETKPYRLLDGWRRLSAAKLVGLKAVPAIIREKLLGDGDKLLHQFIINCQRQDPKALEKSRALAQVMELTGWNAAETAQRVGMSSAGVTKALSLLTLPQPIQRLIEQGRLAPSAAYEISCISDPAQQLELANKAANGELTRDDLAMERKRSKRKKPRKSRVVQRVTAVLGQGRAVTISGPAVNLGALASWLEELLIKIREAVPLNTPLPEFLKTLKDQARG